jgi:hypothetical protein
MLLTWNRVGVDAVDVVDAVDAVDVVDAEVAAVLEVAGSMPDANEQPTIVVDGAKAGVGWASDVPPLPLSL